MFKSSFQRALRVLPAILAAATFVGICTSAHGEKPKRTALANIAAATSDDAVGTPAKLIDQLTFHRDGRERSVSGRVLVEASDGGVLIQSDDGEIWIVEGKDIVDHKHTDRPFVPATAEEIGKRLLAKAPADFRIYTTPH
jgi:hypothetical protein